MGPTSVTSVVPTYTSSATSASSASGTCGGTATVAMPSTSRPRATGRYAADSTHGPGTACRPSASKATHTSTGVASVASIGDAQLGQPRPELQPRVVVAVGPGARSLDGVGAGQQPLERGREVALVLGQLEPHRRTSRGSPRIRSATMLRCTSLVPA